MYAVEKLSPRAGWYRRTGTFDLTKAQAMARGDRYIYNVETRVVLARTGEVIETFGLPAPQPERRLSLG